MKGWIGIDLDGTLAEYDGWQGAKNIGKPVPLMVERVKKWIEEGTEVRIFTARVSSNNPDRAEAYTTVLNWLIENIGCELNITSEKDYELIELWDDRCVQVIPNKGIALRDLIKINIIYPMDIVSNNK